MIYSFIVSLNKDFDKKINLKPNNESVFRTICSQKALKDFDNLTTQLVAQAEKDVTPQMEIQQTHARLDLKEKQLHEMSDAMRKYSPSEEMYKKYEEEARLAAEEAKRYKNEVKLKRSTSDCSLLNDYKCNLLKVLSRSSSFCMTFSMVLNLDIDNSL